MKPARAGGSGGEDERLHGSYLKRLSTAGGKERLSWRGWERVSSCPSPGRESLLLQYAESGCASYCRRICKIRGLENVCKVVKLESQLLRASWCPSASRLRGLGFSGRSMSPPSSCCCISGGFKGEGSTFRAAFGWF